MSIEGRSQGLRCVCSAGFLSVCPGMQALAVQKAAEKVAESKAKELAYIRQVRP